MNVYDTANRLGSELKSSEEYVNYKMAKETINLRPDLKEKIQDFEKMRYDIQIEEMKTGKNDEEKMKKMQELYAEVIEIDEVKKFFDAELKFNVMLADVNKIIVDSVKDVV